jgi:invasion protein IalB
MTITFVERIPMSTSHVLMRGIAAAAVVLLVQTAALAQDAAAPAADAAAAPAADQAAKPVTPPPPPAGWTVQCANPTGAADGGLQCQAEQAIYVMPSRQLLVSVVMRIPTDTKAPTMFVRVPSGISIQAGVEVKVDEGQAQKAVLETCDPQSCFGNLPVTPELVTAISAGKTLNVGFQNMKKETITVPVPLAGFAAAYQKIQ